MAENSKFKTVMVNAEGGISYPENFISANNIAQTTLIDGANSTFQSAVSGALAQIGETNLIGPVSIENGLKCYSDDSSNDVFTLNSGVLSQNIIEFIANGTDGSTFFGIGHDGGSGDGRLNIKSDGQYSAISLTSGGWGDGSDGSSQINIATSKTVDSAIKISNHNERVPSNDERYYDTDSELYLNNDNYAQLSYKKTYKGPGESTSGMCPICYNNIKLYDNGMDLIHSYDFKRPDGDNESEEWGDNSKIQLSGGLIHLEAGGYPYPPANFININGGGNYTDGIIIQTYNDYGEGGGPIHLNGQVFVNGTSLTDLIGAGSSVDLSNYQTKLNYYSESVYDDGSSHVFITAEQTKIGDNKTYIDVMPYYYSKSITIQNDEGDINISSNTSLNLNYIDHADDSINENNYAALNNQNINIGWASVGGYNFGYYKLIGNKTHINGRVINIGNGGFSDMGIPGASINLYGTAITISSSGISTSHTGSYIKLDGDNISLEPDPSPNDGHIKMGTYFTAPVYTENDDGSYTKTNKTVELRVVERDGAYTIVIDDN